MYAIKANLISDKDALTRFFDDSLSAYYVPFSRLLRLQKESPLYGGLNQIYLIVLVKLFTKDAKKYVETMCIVQLYKQVKPLLLHSSIQKSSQLHLLQLYRV